MWNQRESTNAQRNNNGGERSIAVAVDKDKTSQYALRWALDHIVTRNESLKLVHVKERPLSPRPIPIPPVHKDDVSKDQQIDSNTMELLLPFRCFCRRRQVQCETILLEDVDVSKAIIEFVCQHRIDTLLLGSATRNGLSRLFKGTDIPGNLLKWAPDFCTVYVVSKGKINTVRTATRPVPSLNISSGGLPLAQRNSTVEPPHSTLYERWYDEMPAGEMDNPMSTCSERPSTDSNFLHFYEHLGVGGCELNCRESPKKSNIEGRFFDSPPFRPSPAPDHITSITHCNHHDLENDRMSWSSFNNNMDLYEDEMRRLKTELKQTIDMYHAACKEALASKQKIYELEKWKREEERRLQEEERQMDEQNINASIMVAREKSKCNNNVTIRAAEAVQKLVEVEVQKRIDAEMKLTLSERENEEKHKLLDALSQSHNIVLKYQSLYHMITVLFLFYFYFSIFH